MLPEVVTLATESVMAADDCDKKFSFQPLAGKKYISLSGKDLQESLMKWYSNFLYLSNFGLDDLVIGHSIAQINYYAVGSVG